MKITRIKNLLPAPKDAEQLFLVVSPEKLLLSESGSFKGSDGVITVEVWKQKGDEEPTQEGMGEFSVSVFKNGSSTVSIIQRNKARFTFQASTSDTSIDIKLKVGDAFTQTITVTITADGKTGTAGTSYYTWIRYADTITFDSEGNATGGTGMSNSPVDASGKFKEYIGFAYNKTTPTESDSYGQYKWTKYKGTDGTDGIPGEPGVDGQTFYTWIKYADAVGSDGYPSSMYDEPTSSTEYIGIAVNKTTQTESNTPTDYTWSKFKGDQGVQGPQGPQGEPGIAYYTWIRYADTISFDGSGNATGGTGMSNSPVDGEGNFKKYIGFAYNKTTATESNSYSQYKWTLFKGTDGEDGIDGEPGADGQSLYTWIKYADTINALGYPNSSSDIYDTPKATTQYIGIAVNKESRTEGTDPTEYTWSKFKGDQGVQGPQGEPGVVYYTWIRYADSITFDSEGCATGGSGMSNSPVDGSGNFKEYIGFAYNKTTSTESDSYTEYKWTKFKGTDGTNGIDGEPGADGKSLYTWIKYADSVNALGYPESASDIYDTPKTTTQYIGIAVNKTTSTEGTNPRLYSWSKFKGDQGVQGPPGEPGVVYYTWIRYADSITFDGDGNVTGGSGMSNSPVDGSGNFKEYIGFAYNKTTATESDSYTEYKWTKFKGTDGTNGINGEPGANGQTLYTWIKYADAVGSDGYPSSMYDEPTSSTEYIGIAVNKTTQTESDTPSDYTWSKFKGDQGVQGPQGEPGVVYYTWIRYADSITFDSYGNATGGSGMSDSPVDGNGNFKEYIGFAYNKTTATESNSYTQYKWTKFKGTDGANGINGEPGRDGVSFYTWIKYADAVGSDGYPSSMYDEPVSSTEYIGIAVNKTTQTESNTPSDYTWSKFKGDQGVPGPVGPGGSDGNGISSTEFWYLATTMATGVTRDIDAANWTSTYQMATEDKPYVWRYTKTNYTDSGKAPDYSECELIFSYSSGANANLLEQTNFSSLLAMTKWPRRGVMTFEDSFSVSDNTVSDGTTTRVLEAYGNIATGIQAHNAYEDKTSYGREILKWKSILAQAVTDKIEPSTWYTLSFWMKAYRQEYVYPLTSEKTSSSYGFFSRKIYLKAGHQYTLYANGYVNDLSQGHLLIEIGNMFSGEWEGWNININTTYSSTGSVTFTPTHTGLFNLKSFSWASNGVAGGTCTVNWYRLVKHVGLILEAKFYPGFADTSQPLYKDGERITANVGANTQYGATDGWVRHTITFKSASSISGAQQVEFMLHPAEIDGMLHQVFICMPKLEVGLQATSYLSNENMLHQAQPRRRRWALDTQYLAGGVDEPYLDAVICQAGGETTFSRCIKSHVSTDLNKPGGTNGAEFWTSENSAYFENLSTDLFFATKAYVDNLIATLIQTGYEGAPHIEAEGAEFKIFGKGQYPAIYLAVNDDNKAVLRFQNENTGEFLYDLGPDGIMKEFSEVADSYSEFKYHKLTNVTRVSELLNITASQCTSYYRFSEGYKQIGSGSSATKQYHISGTSTPSAKNSCFFTSKNYNGSYIPDGWYCKSNNGTYMAMSQDEPGQTSVHVVYIYQFSSGKLASSVPVYFKYTDTQHASHSVGCDENGNELSTLTYTYLYSYWQENNITL